MKDNKEVLVYHINDDKLTYKEFFSLIVKKKRLLILITGTIMLISMIYIILATQWWQVNATFEIGKFIDEETGKKVYMEKGEIVSERLKVEYIDSYKYIKDRDRDVKITSITFSEKNPQLITIVAMGRNTNIAIGKIHKIINGIKNKHTIIMNEVYAKGMISIEEINKKIYKLKNEYIKQTLETRNNIKQIQIPLLNKKEKILTKSIEEAITLKEEITNKLRLLNKNASLSTLLILQLKIIEDRISTDKLRLIDFEKEKKTLINTRLVELERKLLILKKIDLERLREKKKLILMKFQENNFYNTEIVGKIVTQKKPVKPKKIFIILFSFILGIIISIITMLFINIRHD